MREITNTETRCSREIMQRKTVPSPGHVRSASGAGEGERARARFFKYFLKPGVEPELCKLVSLPIDVAARRTPSGRGRCPMAVARSQIPGDYTRTQRWRTGAKTSLPGRKWLVRQCGQTSLKCTTCAPGESGSTLRGPRVYGEYPARTSWQCEARPATGRRRCCKS